MAGYLYGGEGRKDRCPVQDCQWDKHTMSLKDYHKFDKWDVFFAPYPEALLMKIQIIEEPRRLRNLRIKSYNKKRIVSTIDSSDATNKISKEMKQRIAQDDKAEKDEQARFRASKRDAYKRKRFFRQQYHAELAKINEEARRIAPAMHMYHSRYSAVDKSGKKYITVKMLSCEYTINGPDNRKKYPCQERFASKSERNRHYENEHKKQWKK